MRSSPQAIGMVSATLAATCWGLATVMSKGALAQVPPIMLLVIQLASSVVFLWTWLLLRGVRLAAIRDAFRIAWLGLLEPGLAYVLALIGLADASAANATLIGSSEAIMIAVLSAVLLRERLSMGFFALSAVALTGLLTALGVGGTMSGGVTGNGLLALGTGVAAIYVVLSGRLMGDRDPILVVACQHLVAGALALLLLPIEIMHGHRFAFEAMPPSIWALAVGSGIVQYALAFSFYLAAMRTIATSVVGAFLYLGPIVGLAGAFVFLGERFSPLQIAGAVLTILALLALSWSHGAKPAPDAAASPRTLRP